MNTLVCGRRSAHRINLTNTHETAISTIENPPEAAARLFESQFQQERTSHPGQSPPDRPQASDAGLGAAMASLGLPRARRIKQGRDFGRTKLHGRRVVSGCLAANWL